MIQSTNRFLLLSFLLIIFFMGEATANVKSGAEEAAKARIQETYGKLPLYFIKNDGQVDEKVKFYEKGSGHATYFTKEGVYITLVRGEKLEDRSKKSDDRSEKLEDTFPVIVKDEAPKQSLPKIPSPLAGEGEGGGDKGDMTSQLIKLTFLNANPNPEIIAADQQEGKVNYFIGKDPEKWRTNVPTYKAVLYKEVYPGIDIKFYGNNRQMEYDIIVKPGADPNKVKFSYDGIKDLKITEDGELEIALNEGEIIQKKPYIYQEIDGKKVEVEGRFKYLKSSAAQFTYSFEVASYDTVHPLIIDPTLVYSTYLGGSGEDWGTGIAVDTAGNAYVTGDTPSTNFPTTSGAYDRTFNGVYDVFVVKLNASGSALSYATYLGGSGDEFEYGGGIAVDASGNAYVMGDTYSTNFPTHWAYGGYNDSTYDGGSDIFVVKLNASGSALSYSTYLYGSSGDEYGKGIAVDASGHIYVLEDYYPNGSGYFSGNASDIIVQKLTLDGTPPFNAWLGGNGIEMGGSIVLDASGDVYVTGQTSSTDFLTTPGAYDTTFNGGSWDAFVAKLDKNYGAISYATYLGGSNVDGGFGISVDTSGNAYVTGTTSSMDFPTTFGAYDTTLSGGGDAFVVKLNASGSALSYATYLGGSSYDGGYGIEVDTSGNAYVTGYTDSTDFPTVMAYDTTYNGGIYDAFVTKLNASGSALSFSTYLGGSGEDQGIDMAVDTSGNVYVTGATASTDFPTTYGAYDTTFNGVYDTFIEKISIDSDGDGLPDGWETQYGLNPNDPGDAGVDSDFDNFNNLEEYIGQTNPSNGASVPASQTVFDGNMLPVRLVAPPDTVVTSFSWTDPATLPLISGSFPYGLVSLTMNVSAPGATTTVAITFPGAVDTTSVYNKYGPTASDPSNHWYNFSFGSNDGDGVITLTLVDGGAGDHDLVADGVIHDPGGPYVPVDVLINNSTGNQQTQTVAWNDVDNEYLVLWQDFRNGSGNPDIYGARLDIDGNVIATDLPIVTQTAKQAGPWLSYGGGGYIAVWIDQRTSGTTGTDVYGAWILPDGSLSSEFVVTNATANQRAASVVYNPDANNFLVTWIDDTSGTSNLNIGGAIVNPGGGVGIGPFAMVTATGNQRGPYARYDYGTSQYFMVWFDNRNGNYDVYGSRVSSGGALLDGSGLVISNATGDQKNARMTDRRPVDGVSNFVLSWIDFRNGQADIYGALIDEYGTKTGSDIQIAGGSYDQRAASIDVDYVRTKQAVVSWIDNRNGTDFDIYRAQVDQSGVVSGEALVAGAATGAANNQQGPLVSYSDDGGVDNGFLMLWRDNRSGVDYDLYGIKVWP